MSTYNPKNVKLYDRADFNTSIAKSRNIKGNPYITRINLTVIKSIENEMKQFQNTMDCLTRPYDLFLFHPMKSISVNMLLFNLHT